MAVDLFRSPSAAAAAVQYFEHLGKSLSSRIGPPEKAAQTLTPQYLAAGLFRRAANSYRYSDYFAEVSVMNYGKERGILVREQYQWVPPA